MTRARQLCLAVVALATSARAAGPSKAVLALRAAPAQCNVTDEPKRFMVFTRQRSGSRWFVDTISALGDGRRFVEPHIRELSLNGTPFHTRFVAAAADTGYDANACASREPSPACSCLLRGVYAASARLPKNAGKAVLFSVSMRAVADDMSLTPALGRFLRDFLPILDTCACYAARRGARRVRERAPPIELAP